YRANPRATRPEALHHAIEDNLSSMREQIQRRLSRMKLRPQITASDKGAGRRTSLGPGSYAEIELCAPTIAWHGIADLINVSHDSSEIIEFKTGKPREEHAFQLRIYSLLWKRDSEMNPAGRAANTLVLSYTHRDVSVAPLETMELGRFEE